MTLIYMFANTLMPALIEDSWILKPTLDLLQYVVLVEG